MSGAIWYIDENKRLQFRYPSGDNQGIIIKDYWEDTDSGDYVAYIEPTSTFTYMDSTKPEDGFAQQLFAVAEATEQVGFNTRATSFMSLAGKNAAFAVIPGVNRLSNMTFMMSKVGGGSIEPNPAVAKIRGEIITDNNHSPTGTVIATFAIPIAAIPDVPTPIIKIDRPNFKDLDIDKLHWIKLYGDGSGDDNTIRVWHDDDKTTPSTEANPRYTALQFHKDGITNKIYSKANWIVSSQGPQFSIAFATSQNIIVEASDEASVAQWSTGTRPIQAMATIPSMKNIEASRQYLRVLVQQTSQKIRNYGNLKVSIPNNLISAGTEVQLASNMIKSLLFENSATAITTSVQYHLDVKEYAIGSKTCDISLRGYVAPL
jgi:hypothetical protein